MWLKGKETDKDERLKVSTKCKEAAGGSRTVEDRGGEAN